MNELVENIIRAFYKFPQRRLGPPTRLHVSSTVYDQLLEYLARKDAPLRRVIVVKNCPVTEIPDLGGFRWVRERKYSWDAGPLEVVS